MNNYACILSNVQCSYANVIYNNSTVNETNEMQLNQITVSYLAKHMNCSCSMLSAQFDSNKSNKMHFLLPEKKEEFIVVWMSCGSISIFGISSFVVRKFFGFWSLSQLNEIHCMANIFHYIRYSFESTIHAVEFWAIDEHFI